MASLFSTTIIEIPLNREERGEEGMKRDSD